MSLQKVFQFEINVLTDVQKLANAEQAANVQADASTIESALASGGVTIPFFGLYQAAVNAQAGNISKACGAVIDIISTFETAVTPTGTNVSG